jgi:hypothetical protein
MKRLLLLLLLLPSLGSCTIESDYYGYHRPPRVRIVTPHHPHYRPVPIPPKHHHHRKKKVIIIRKPPRRVVPHVVVPRPRVRGHVHGHD